jgi:hypothetical protein
MGRGSFVPVPIRLRTALSHFTLDRDLFILGPDHDSLEERLVKMFRRESGAER